MPAYFNGVYGHKTSSNFISNHYQHPPAEGLQENMLSTGPICRYASDLRLVFKILAGPRYKEVSANFETYVI
jgi:fatty acid amide hydrolase 2